MSSNDNHNIEDIERWYNGDWRGFTFTEGKANFTVIDETSYAPGTWGMVYDNPSERISGGGIVIDESKLKLKLLDTLIEYIKGLQS